MVKLLSMLVRVAADFSAWMGLAIRPRKSLEAEILFLRRQLALYVERGGRPRRIDAATRVTLALLSRFFQWQSSLLVVRPQTLVRWYRAGFRRFWKWKSRPGRPPIPAELRRLIRRMAAENPSWGQERIANELWLKLGVGVSPRTVRKYLPTTPAGRPRSDQRWSTFLRNHAQAIVACDFFVSVTSTFRLLYVFVVIEQQTRRLIHCNVTAHPSASWTSQQLRDALWYDTRYQYLIHDCDSIFSCELDNIVEGIGLQALKTPPHGPMANAICERVIGTIRRECLDWLVPVSAAHLRGVLKRWITHYNQGRPHMALGHGVPDPPAVVASSIRPRARHGPIDFRSVRAKPILGGLHHEYALSAA